MIRTPQRLSTESCDMNCNPIMFSKMNSSLLKIKTFLNNVYSKSAPDDDLGFLKHMSAFKEKLDSDTCLALPCDSFNINSLYKIASIVLENHSIQYAAFTECIDTWLTIRRIEWKEVFELRIAESHGALKDVFDIDSATLETLKQFQPNCIETYMQSDKGYDFVNLDKAAAVLEWGLRSIFIEVEMTSKKVEDYCKKVNAVRILCEDQETKRIYHHLALTLLQFLSYIAIHGDLAAAKCNLNNVGLASVGPSSLTTEYVACVETTSKNMLMPYSHDIQNEFYSLEMAFYNLKSELDVNALRLIRSTMFPVLNDWLDVSDSSLYASYSDLPYMETISSRGFKKDVKLTVGIVLMILVSALIGVTSWALSNHQTLQNYNIDPTSLISLFIVVEGLLLAAFVALYAENWSWHDMIRGQLYVMDFEELGKQSKAIDKASLIKHVIDNASQYEHIVSCNYLCYVDYEFKGNVVMPHGLTVYELKKAGYSVMLTSQGYYVRLSGGDKHRIASKVSTDDRYLHVGKSATPEGVPLINHENLIVAGTMSSRHTTVINIEAM